MGGGEKDVDVVGHDNEGVDVHSILRSLVLKMIHHEAGGAGDLKDAAALRGDESQKVGSCMLRSAVHLGSLAERAGAKALCLGFVFRGAEAPRSLLMWMS